MSTENAYQLRIKPIIAALISACSIITLVTWEIFFHKITQEHTETMMYLVIGAGLLTIIAAEENVRGFYLRMKAAKELAELERKLHEVDENYRVFTITASKLAKEKEVAENLLEKFLRRTKEFVTLDLNKNKGAIQDQLVSAFREHDPSVGPIVVLSSFDSTNGILSLDSFLSLKAQYPKTTLSLIDTKEPYPAIPELLKTNPGIRFYLSHYAQIFDPIIFSSTRLLISFQGKVLVLPVGSEGCQADLNQLEKNLAEESVLVMPEYSKKFEYFTQVFPLLSGKVLDSIREDGYSFSATNSKLWFVEPLSMCKDKLALIKEDMEREFKIFSDEIIPISDEIIANWPLTIIDWPLKNASDLSLITSESILNWLNGLQNSISSDSQKKVTRYFYLSADQHFKTDTNVIGIKGRNWIDPRNNKENSFDDVLKFLRAKFVNAQGNYRVFIVLVSKDSDELKNAFRIQKDTLWDVEEFLSNWIIFSSQRLNLSILQYERRLEYPRNGAHQEVFSAFFYDDIVDSRLGTHQRIKRYSNYAKLLATATTVATQKITKQNVLKTQKQTILPIKVFFELLDQGQISVTAA